MCICALLSDGERTQVETLCIIGFVPGLEAWCSQRRKTIDRPKECVARTAAYPVALLRIAWKRDSFSALNCRSQLGFSFRCVSSVVKIITRAIDGRGNHSLWSNEKTLITVREFDTDIKLTTIHREKRFVYFDFTYVDSMFVRISAFAGQKNGDVL